MDGNKVEPMSQSPINYRFEQLRLGMQERSNLWEKLWFLARFSLKRFDVAVQFVVQKLTRKRFDCVQFIKRVLNDLGFDKNIQPL